MNCKIRENNDRKKNSERGAKCGTRQKLFIKIVKWVTMRYGLLFKKNYIYFSYIIVTFIQVGIIFFRFFSILVSNFLRLHIQGNFRNQRAIAPLPF